MSMIIGRAEKGPVLYVFDLICRTLLFHRCSPEARAQVQGVLNGMKAAKEDFFVDCKFATDPPTRQVQILITAQFTIPPEVKQ